MVVALHYDQLVRREVLGRHIPRLASAAEADALPLADGVEGEPDVLADRAAAIVDHRARPLRQVAIQELAEGSFADEENAGRILLGMVRQARLERHAPHLGFL